VNVQQSIKIIPRSASTLRNTRDAIRKTSYYAKQTQFLGDSNEHNFCYDKPLRQFSSLRPPQKQSQNKPNQTQFQSGRNPKPLPNCPASHFQISQIKILLQPEQIDQMT
jgi:hypothetical protein